MRSISALLGSALVASIAVVCGSLFFVSVPALAAPVTVYWCAEPQPVTGAPPGYLNSVSPDGTSPATVRTAGDGARIRGCTVSQTANQLYFAEDGTILRTSRVNTGQVEVLNTTAILGGMALDEAGQDLYWTDASGNAVRRVDLLNLGTDAAVFSSFLDTPLDIELDLTNGKIYVSNFNSGDIVRANIDGSSPEVVVDGAFGTWGVAVAPSIGKIFWANPETSQIWSANLDGTGQTNLSSAIGALSNPSDIDYVPSSNSIWWVQFNVDGSVGRLRRAAVDGSGAQNVVTSGIPRARYLSILSDDATLAPTLTQPAENSSFVSSLPLQYTLPEVPLSGSVRLQFRQGSTTVAQLAMFDATNVSTSIDPFLGVISNSNVSSSSGFPLSAGVYAVVLTYQDALGNPAASVTNGAISILQPTPTPTVTATATVTPSPTATVAPTSTSTPTPAPTVCSAPLRAPSVRVRGRVATVSVQARAGVAYQVQAIPGGISQGRIRRLQIPAGSKRKVTVSFERLGLGEWRFLYRTQGRRPQSSCPVTRVVSRVR